MAQFEHYLAAFGPIAILLGAAFEGQTAVIAGGVMARQDMISLFMAVGAAALGSTLLDHLLFIVGRSFRGSNFVQKAATKPAFDKAIKLIERYPSVFILCFRFLYGLRAAGPVAVGVCKVSHAHFAVLNVVGALIWAGVFVALGYVFGPAVMTLLGALMAHAAPIAVGLGIAALLALVVWRWRVWTGQERPAAGRPDPTPEAAPDAP